MTYSLLKICWKGHLKTGLNVPDSLSVCVTSDTGRCVVADTDIYNMMSVVLLCGIIHN